MGFSISLKMYMGSDKPGGVYYMGLKTFYIAITGSVYSISYTPNPHNTLPQSILNPDILL